jgi:drug/metabolite transporter (DMT)-like permease
MTLRRFLAESSLLLVVALWGATFVMVQNAVRDWPVFSLLTLRFGVATLSFLPIALWHKFRRRSSADRQHKRHPRQRGWSAVWPPLLIGALMLAGYAFQTAGLLFTTPAQSGFISGMTVVLVPLAAAWLLYERPGLPAILGIGLATAGLALISITEQFTINFGDLLTLFSAASFAVQIVLTGRYSGRYQAWALTAVQSAVAMVGSALLALIFEVPAGLPPLTANVVTAALVTGIINTTLAFTVMAIALRYTDATHAALIFAAEPVFAAWASYLLIGEVLSPRQVAGCGLILLGMIGAELGTLWLRRRNAAVEPAAIPV